MNTSDKPQHECGVFGVYGHPDAALLTYYGLFALQHRGQESAGIVTAAGSNQPFNIHRGMGLVSQVFQEKDLQQLRIGTRAIGHVRYSTSGSSTLKNAQPLVVDCARGQLAIAHNGNLVNAAVLREELESNGSIFQTTVDSEIILHLLARPTGRKNVLSALRLIEGAFSFVLMGEQEIIGVRDPFGFRPLVLGKLDDAFILASETCALDLVHADYIREIEPGEVVIINDDGIRSEWPFKEERKAFCIFEYVYFARPDSLINDRNVSKARVAMGVELAKLHPVDADIVVPVPDSGNYAALGYSHELNIPYRTCVCAESLYRPHLSAADAAHPRFQRPREAEPDQRIGEREASGGGGRLCGSWYHGASARRKPAGSRRSGSSSADQLSAAQICLLLRHRFS